MPATARAGISRPGAIKRSWMLAGHEHPDPVPGCTGRSRTVPWWSVSCARVPPLRARASPERGGTEHTRGSRRPWERGRPARSGPEARNMGKRTRRPRSRAAPAPVLRVVHESRIDRGLLHIAPGRRSGRGHGADRTPHRPGAVPYRSRQPRRAEFHPERNGRNHPPSRLGLSASGVDSSAWQRTTSTTARHDSA